MFFLMVFQIMALSAKEVFDHLIKL